MTVKQTILAELGDEELLSPDQIARSLVANDQVKYYFALLQSARGNANRPQVPPVDLKAERIASQLSDAWLDEVVGGTRKQGAALYRIPHAPELLRRIKSAIEAMLACLPADQRLPFAARLAKLEPQSLQHGALPGRAIHAMTSADRKVGDSLHLLVMDAHRAINALQAATAVDSLAGARIHNLSGTGRRRVEAFMAGLNRTAPLKFNHPGLGTTATEHNGYLLIQNDIGTTDAHVLVVRVRALKAMLTYTDIHRPRLEFFQSLFSAFAMAWEGTDKRMSERLESEAYLLTTGTFEAADEAQLLGYLEHLGSRIVFLIDWNRMRKRLAAFVSRERSIAVLKWAADHDFGHRALIELGGERALADAVEYAAGQRLRYGVRLDGLIDEDSACEFLKFALQCASVGLRQRRSRRNILDEIKARLRRYFENQTLGIFNIAAEHVACGYDLAIALYEGLERIADSEQQAWISKFAHRASRLEKQADQLLNEAREDIKRFKRPRLLLEFFEFADDAVDELEEAAALLDLCALLPPPPTILANVRELAALSVRSAQELVKSVECAASVERADVRDDLDEFLMALEQLIAIEHCADEQLRILRRRLIEQHIDQRQTMLVRELSQALETATDASLHAGQMLRQYLMDEVIA
jgi:uncharacterized protein Yka (UPF0111/DUF47 family)